MDQQSRITLNAAESMLDFREHPARELEFGLHTSDTLLKKFCRIGRGCEEHPKMWVRGTSESEPSTRSPSHAPG